MQTSTDDGKVFDLRAESEADQLFIEALDMRGACLRWERMVREERIPHSGAFANVGAVLTIDRQHPASIRADAARQALSAIGQLLRLGLREAAQDGHVGATTPDPQAQEQAAASLIELKGVLQTLRDVVSEQKLVLEEMVRAHGSPPNDEKDILPAIRGRTPFCKE